MSYFRKWALAALLVAVGAFAAPGLALGDDPAAPACDEPDVQSLSAADCAGAPPVPSLDPADAADPPTVAALSAQASVEAAALPSPAELPSYCREHANVVFWTSSDWLRLGQKLAANASPCADYYISIPPLAADKTKLRCLQDDLIRALGPRFHPVVEFHFAGWNAWRIANHKTLGDAAHEFLKRVHECGYDFSLGETWTLNEMHSGIRRNVPGARANMRLLLNTLAAGAPEMPAAKGIVFVIGFGQNTFNVSDYKPQSEEWLQDTPFWQDMSNDVSVWAQEAYPDMRYWGVADASRNERTRNLSLYLEHPLLLAEAGPPSVATARDYLEQTYVPLASAAWPWDTGFGFTAWSDDQMKRFIAEQTFAVKHFSLTRPQGATDGRFAMAWSPGNLVCPTMKLPPEASLAKCSASVFAELTGGILDRLASSIRYAYEQGRASQAGACGPPGDHSWCTGDIPTASFNPLWSTYPDWNVG